MGLFHHDDGSGSSANHTCPMPRPLTEDATDPIVGGLSFYHLNMIISGACTAFSLSVILALMIRHATHHSNANEQLKIMRICILIPIYGILSFIAIVAPVSFAYINPWIDVFQAVALGDFFLLMCEFITPNERHRDLFFSALEIPQKKKNKAAVDGLTWYRRKWIMIFQYVVVSIIIAVATDATEGANVYCLKSSKRYFAHLWLDIIHSVSLTFAVMAVLSFYSILKKDLASHRPLAKLLAFKLLVGIIFLLQIIYWILGDINPSPLKPTTKLNYADIQIGIPLLIRCILMVPFSLFFHWAYSVSPYIIRRDEIISGAAAVPRRYQGGFLGSSAWLALLNPSEIIQAIGFACRMASAKQDYRAIDAPERTDYVMPN